MEARNLYDESILISYNEGDTSLEPVEKIIKDDINDSSHIVKDGDTLQSISHKFYKDSRKWWLIARKNQLDDVFNLIIGSELIIPNNKRL